MNPRKLTFYLLRSTVVIAALSSAVCPTGARAEGPEAGSENLETPGLTLMGPETFADPDDAQSRVTFHRVHHQGTGLTVHVSPQYATLTTRCRFQTYNPQGQPIEPSRVFYANHCTEGIPQLGGLQGNLPNTPNTFRIINHERIPTSSAHPEIPPAHRRCVAEQLDAFQEYFDRFPDNRKVELRRYTFRVSTTDNLQRQMPDERFELDPAHQRNMIPERPMTRQTRPAAQQTAEQAPARRESESEQRQFAFLIGINSEGECDIAGTEQFRAVFDANGEMVSDLAETLRRYEDVLREMKGLPPRPRAHDRRQRYARGDQTEVPAPGINEDGQINPAPPPPIGVPEQRPIRASAQIGV